MAYSPADTAEHFLALFEPGLEGARSALEICSATQTILRDRVDELEQEPNPKQVVTAIPPREESRLVQSGSDVLLLVCSYLRINEKVRFRTSSLGLHSLLLGCAIDLTESKQIRKLATIEFVLDKLVTLRKFSNHIRGYEACSCSVARTIYGMHVGACLSLAGQCDATHPKVQKLESIGFGCSWSVAGLTLMQESDEKQLSKLLAAIQHNQITKIAIGSRSVGILTAIGQAVEKGKLTRLQQIYFYSDGDPDYVESILEPDYLGTLSNFGPAFRRLNLNRSKTMDISGLGTCKSLRTLHLSGTKVTDVSALGSCSNLRKLDLGSTQVANVSALGSCSNLHELHLYNTQVVNVSALGLCSSLHTLRLGSTNVVDVYALGTCHGLHTLYLNNTNVADVSALGSCSSLRTLDLDSTQVTDVSALGSCGSLHTLNLDNTNVAEISALGSCGSLHTLQFDNTEVADVSALGSCSGLRILSIAYTAVTNTSAITSQIKHLEVIPLAI